MSPITAFNLANVGSDMHIVSSLALIVSLFFVTVCTARLRLGPFFCAGVLADASGLSLFSLSSACVISSSLPSPPSF